MRMIFVDAKNRQVREIDEKPELKTYYKYIGCDLVDAVRFPNRDAGYVDDEGLLKNPSDFIFFKGSHAPLAGNMVIVGTDEEGDDVPPKMTIDWVLENVRFFTLEELIMATTVARILEKGLEQE